MSTRPALRLKVEVWPGASIERACEEAQLIADTLRVNVGFDFNGVLCIASPDCQAALLAERWNEQAQLQNVMHRVAGNRP